MLVKTNNHISLMGTAKVNAKQFLHDHGPAICEKVDTFFRTQAGSRN